MSAGYKRLDDIEFPEFVLAELLVCDTCGALVFPTLTGRHDIEHEWSEGVVDRLDHIEGIGGDR